MAFSFNNVQGIIFDLDDTLVKSQLDFVGMKKHIGCPENHDILTFIECLPHKEASQARQIVYQHELDDARTSKWLPGASNFVNQALSNELPLAIVTRNCLDATKIKIANNNIPIDFVLTREDAPPKPDPTALNIIAQDWNIERRNIAYIGDYHYDIKAAHNANMQAWLYAQSEQSEEYVKCLSFIPK